jgi:hypothetical protein
MLLSDCSVLQPSASVTGLSAKLINIIGFRTDLSLPKTPDIISQLYRRAYSSSVGQRPLEPNRHENTMGLQGSQHHEAWQSGVEES